MYMILKKVGADSENVWAFHTEDGILFTATLQALAVLKLEDLSKITPASNLRLIQVIPFQLIVEVTPPDEEPEEEPDEEPIEP